LKSICDRESIDFEVEIAPSLYTFSRTQNAAISKKNIIHYSNAKNENLNSINNVIDVIHDIIKLKDMDTNVAAYSVSEFCGDFGLTPVQLNKVLKDIGVQKKVDNIWKINEQYDTEGYVLLVEGRDPYHPLGIMYQFTKQTDRGLNHLTSNF